MAAGSVIKNPKEHIGKLCHVVGWPLGCVFRLLETDGKNHTLITTKTGRTYRLNKTLLHTRRQMEEMHDTKETQYRKHLGKL